MITSEKINIRTTIGAVTVETSDISEYVDFDFYDLVWYHTGKNTRSRKENQSLRRWMIVMRSVGSDMSYWIMQISVQPIA